MSDTPTSVGGADGGDDDVFGVMRREQTGKLVPYDAKDPALLAKMSRLRSEMDGTGVDEGGDEMEDIAVPEELMEEIRRDFEDMVRGGDLIPSSDEETEVVGEND
ncbi:MAG: hypothetical protein V1679_01680 [Candidatus Peregrinibacteria bacterium]